MNGQAQIMEARIPRGSVAALYASLAPRYDWWARLTESQARKRCLELAEIKDGERVLEVAVGTGTAFAEILRRNPSGRNEGLDITPAMVGRARKKAERTGSTNFRLQVGDAYHLPYGASAFDVIINNYMFDLMPEKDFPVVLGEFIRVLRPGGRLILVNMATGRHWYNGLWERIYRIHPAAVGGCRGVNLEPHLETVGFKVIRSEWISQLTFPSEILLANRP